MIRINQLKLKLTEPEEKLRAHAAKLLGVSEQQILSCTLQRRSIDARDREHIRFSCTVLVETAVKNEAALVRRLKNNNVSLAAAVRYEEPRLPAYVSEEGAAPEKAELFFAKEENRPIVVGFGPAGMFAALLLAKAGMRPIVFERGASVEERVEDVRRLWEEGVLNPASNPQFGEGGAGTFSDGKLNTLTKDSAGRSAYVLRKFVEYGADARILTDAKPHVGTDRLVSIVKGIREEILSLGGEIRFHSKYCYGGEKTVVLATGHSSRDTYEELHRAGLLMEAKDFAMGFRVQHPQTQINRALYGEVSEEALAALGQGAYKLSHTCSTNGRGVYSFCMCPGGYVVNAASEEGRLCVNGMSYHARDGVNANAAIIVSVRKSDYQGDTDPLGGIALQRALEARTHALAGGKIPLQLYGDFKEGRCSTVFGEVQPQCKGQYAFAALNEIFRFDADSPYAALNDFNESFMEGMESFARQIPGFNRDDALLAAVESRTSSPVRIPRNGQLQANIPGIYPCGEGAGYAGGIMSAAMDGMKVAEAIVKKYQM